MKSSDAIIMTVIILGILLLGIFIYLFSESINQEKQSKIINKEIMKKNPTYFYANSTSYYPENRRYPCNCRNTNQNSDIEIMNVHITPMYAQGPTPRNYFPIPPGPIQGPTPPTNPPITVPITTESH